VRGAPDTDVIGTMLLVNLLRQVAAFRIVPRRIEILRGNTVPFANVLLLPGTPENFGHSTRLSYWITYARCLAVGAHMRGGGRCALWNGVPYQTDPASPSGFEIH
jgi:hypothetical protein